MLETAAPAFQAIATHGSDTIKSDTQIHIRPLSDGEDTDPEAPNLANFDLSATHLISSPYPDVPNQLDLTPLTSQHRLLAFALTTLTPTRSDYATAHYMSAFNWAQVFSTLRALCAQTGVSWQRQEFYVVIFRSKLLPDADRVRLGELDQRSHEEACASGGLLRYWFGRTDAERRNLATCESFYLSCVEGFFGGVLIFF